MYNNCGCYNYAFRNYQINVDAAQRPLTLDEVKAHLKITGTSEDDYLNFLIDSVSDIFETFTNRILINKTYKAFLDCFPVNNYYSYPLYRCSCLGYNGCYQEGIFVLKSKLTSITSIKYKVSGVLTTWNSSNYYFTDTNFYSEVLLTEDGEYPDDVDDVRQAIEIIFVAGFGATEADIPEDIKIAMLNHIAFLYENRGDCSTDPKSCGLPCPVRTIYKRYKIYNLIGVC